MSLKNNPGSCFCVNDFSSFSATTLLGGPTDVYMNGTMYLWFISSVLLCTPVACYIYLPIFHRLQIVSANQVLLISYATQ